MDKIAGTIMVFCLNKEPYFLIEQKEGYRQLVTASYDEGKTNMGAILDTFKEMGLDIEQFELLDLVDVSYKHQHHTPLFVFKLSSSYLPAIEQPYQWVKTHDFQSILGSITLDDIAGIRY